MFRLLVVDDDSDALESLKDILEDNGYHVIPAQSGKAGLDILSCDTVDLALVDLKLKDMSGFDVMRVVGEKYPDIIVIVITGYASTDSAIEALRMGAYDFLRKPFKAEILLNAIERGLEKKQLKELAKAAMETREEGIALIDQEGFVYFTNKALPEMLKYPFEKMQGKSFFSVVSPEDESAVYRCFLKAQKDDPQKVQAILTRKDGAELMTVISFTRVGNRILSVILDISEVSHRPIPKKDMTYKTMPGFIYLSKEEMPERAVAAFNDLVELGYKGAVITRGRPNNIGVIEHEDVRVLRLTQESSGELTIFPETTLIEKKLDPYFSRNRVILFDRLDYLVSCTSFSSVLSLVQKIRDQVLLKESIVILSVDPRTLTERELSMIEKEARPLLPIPSTGIRGDLLELLRYVATRNEVGIKPNHKEIERKFTITRGTVRERLRILHSEGLVIENKRGRTKVVEITERGRKKLTQID